MVVRIAKRYHQRRLNFCIITFYDPQRNAISKALASEKLPTGCVYNVDSFQGTALTTPRSAFSQLEVLNIHFCLQGTKQIM